MSYDLYLRIDTGASEPFEVWWCNYTSNVARMWRAAMPATSGLDGLDGWAAPDALVALERGLAYMDEHRADLEEMSPANGWGDFEGARETVAEFCRACREHPKTTVSISR